MPRVLRIINRLNLGGITYNVTYLTKFMQPEFETILVSGVKTEDEESSEFILDQYGIMPNYIREMKREINFSSDRKAYNEIKSLIQKFKPDIVHTHAAKAGTLVVWLHFLVMFLWWCILFTVMFFILISVH